MRTTRATWEKRVERWRDSGLSAAEYSRELGISARSLKWWGWKLSADAQSVAPKTEPRKVRKTQSPRRRAPATPGVTPLTFVEMAPAAVAPVATPIDIVLRTGVQLRVSVGFDAPTLERVLDVVERRS
jgi:hypothetical protein